MGTDALVVAVLGPGRLGETHLAALARLRERGLVVDALALDKPRVFPRRLPFHLVIRESSGPPARAVPGRIARRSRNPTVGRIKVES